jgi:hypothetical protein
LLLVLLFAVSLDTDVASLDPLVKAFGTRRSQGLWLLLTVLLGASVLLDRFWCRALCPAGAFLSLLGGPRLLRRWLPKIRPGRCLFGVRHEEELDCLQCDRCRRVGEADRIRLWGLDRHEHLGTRRAFYVTALAAAALLLVHQAQRTAAARQADQPFRGSAVEAAGRPRRVDMPRLRQLIQAGELSDREAMYYRRTGTAPAADMQE